MTVHPIAILGTATNYDGLRKLIAHRRQELGLSQLAVDEIAGVQSGYTGKLECGSRHFGDMSLSAVLGALGIGIAVFRSTTSEADLDDISKASRQNLKITRKKYGAKGGRARVNNQTQEQRIASAQHANKARWRQWRAGKAEAERKARLEAKRVVDGQ